jgi:MoxR-like ATPase
MNTDGTPLESALARVREEMGKVIIGQREAIDQALVAILTGQHAIVEGVPGVGKTLLVRTLSRVLGSDFGRIQFTPDLMPSDITGTNVFDLQRREFSLFKGPIFTSFLLADEINRAPAKTQAALLEAMQERTVTIDRQTHSLPANFTVFATQNPIEYEGTYPLPEAQKDRFLLKIRMQPPGLDDEMELARRSLGATAPERVLAGGSVECALPESELPLLKQQLEAVDLREELIAYAVGVVRQTREADSVMVGGGPRATQALLLAARAMAALEERDFVTPDDVKRVALPVLGHRLIVRPEYEIEGLTVAEIVEGLLEEVPVPR